MTLRVKIRKRDHVNLSQYKFDCDFCHLLQYSNLPLKHVQVGKIFGSGFELLYAPSYSHTKTTFLL